MAQVCRVLWVCACAADRGDAVVVLKEVDTIDEAVELANASQYTLSAGLWTQNVHTALDVAARIRSGVLLPSALSLAAS